MGFLLYMQVSCIYVIEFIIRKVGENGVGERKETAGYGFSYWAYYPQASAALPWIRPILSHQKVDLASHFHVVDSPTGFVAFPLSSATRLFVVPPSFDVLNEPIHGEDSV